MDYEDTKDVLRKLIVLNDPQGDISEVEIRTATKSFTRKPKLKDLQDINYDFLVKLCDYLNMSELYLEN